MAFRFKVKRCILSAFLVVLTLQAIALLYLKIITPGSVEETRDQEPQAKTGERMNQNLVAKPYKAEKPPNFHRFVHEGALDVNILKRHEGDEELKIIKSPLGADKLHADDELKHKNVERQKVFGFPTSKPLVIDTDVIFNKMGEGSDCLVQPLTNRSLSSGIFCLPEVPAPKLQTTGRAKCLVETTVSIRDKWECRCKPGWYGAHCSVPEVVEKSDYPYEYGVKIMNQPRRIIYGFPFSYEFEMLEGRMMELGDLVDVFIIVESNYTAYGRPKPRLLWDRLQAGYLQQYHSKIVYVFLDYFPVEALRDGWFVDELIRNYITAQGLSRLRNVKEDDIVILTDADELPTRDLVLYLKIHFGYPEPIALYLRHNTFNFRWMATDMTSRVFGAVTVGMLRHVFTGHAYFIRRATTEMNNHKDLVDNFKYHHGGRINAWSAGAMQLPAGWHCSWCMSGERIKSKLLAAHVSDTPRWGSFPDKTKVDYINKITAAGMWFDDKTRLVSANMTEYMAAPGSMWALNSTDYKHLFYL